jgi:hypothetical protein
MDELNFKDAPDSKQGPEQQQEQSTSTDQAKQVQEKIEDKLGEEYAGIKSKDLPQTPYGKGVQSESLGAARLDASTPPSHDAMEAMRFGKSRVAELIDFAEHHKAADPRLAALAQTQLEIASMVLTKLLSKI